MYTTATRNRLSDDETFPRRGLPDVPARLALVRAELARLHGDPTSHRWADLVEAWTELDAAYERAYAQSRLAEALLDESAERNATVRSQAQAHLVPLTARQPPCVRTAWSARSRHSPGALASTWKRDLPNQHRQPAAARDGSV